MKVEFYKHNIGEEEKQSFLNTLDSIFLAMGPRTKQFEDSLAKYLNVRHVIGTSTCTDSLIMLMKVFNISEGDEVITTPLTFLASANSILAVGAKVIFADVQSDTGLIDVNEIRKVITPKTKSIIPVHLYGHMCDMIEIQKIAKENGLFVIEDCAHCIEGQRNGIKPGQISDGACFSFYATKNITCGEGGAIATQSEAIAEKLQLMRNHGMSKSATERFTSMFQHWDMIDFGLNTKMTDIEASLLIPQLNKIEERWQRKEKIAKRYEKEFNKRGIKFAKTLSGVKNARHLFTIWAQPEFRDKALQELQNREIGCTVNYRAVHLTDYYKQRLGYKRGMYPVSERIGDSTISLPLYSKLSDDEVSYIIDQVIDVLC